MLEEAARVSTPRKKRTSLRQIQEWRRNGGSWRRKNHSFDGGRCRRCEFPPFLACGKVCHQQSGDPNREKKGMQTEIAGGMRKVAAHLCQEPGENSEQSRISDLGRGLWVEGKKWERGSKGEGLRRRRKATRRARAGQGRRGTAREGGESMGVGSGDCESVLTAEFLAPPFCVFFSSFFPIKKWCLTCILQKFSRHPLLSKEF